MFIGRPVQPGDLEDSAKDRLLAFLGLMRNFQRDVFFFLCSQPQVIGKQVRDC